MFLQKANLRREPTQESTIQDLFIMRRNLCKILNDDKKRYDQGGAKRFHGVHQPNRNRSFIDQVCLLDSCDNSGLLITINSLSIIPDY